MARSGRDAPCSPWGRSYHRRCARGWQLADGHPPPSSSSRRSTSLSTTAGSQRTPGLDLELRYFRDVEGREVDFVVVDRRTPVLMAECKLADAPVDRSLRYLKARVPDCPAWQISASGHKDFVTPEGLRARPAIPFLLTLV